MNDWRWRLDPVLRLREFALERARIANARARTEADASETALQAASLALREEEDALARRLKQGVAAWSLGAAVARLAELAATRRERMQRAERAAARAATAHEQLLHARVAARALERLRERAAEVRRTDLARREQAVLDEIAQRIGGRTGGITGSVR